MEEVGVADHHTLRSGGRTRRVLEESEAGAGHGGFLPCLN